MRMPSLGVFICEKNVEKWQKFKKYIIKLVR